MIRFIPNDRQRLILEFLRAQKTASRAEIETHAVQAYPEKNSRITILRDLDLLCREGLAERTGKARPVLPAQATGPWRTVSRYGKPWKS